MKNYFVISLLLILVTACCDCPLEPNDAPEYNCLVREGTITKFNPGLQEVTKGDSTYKVPVPEYSIHTFLFPSNDNSSGSLPNDDRFADSERILITSVPFENNVPFYAAILDVYPNNPDLKGDILLVEANPESLTADLRFYGRLARLPKDLNSDDASLFCEYIESNADDITSAKARASKYGMGIPGAKFYTYNSNAIEVLNELGEIVTGQPGVPSPAGAVISALFNNIGQGAIDVTVEPGDVFYYRAANGKSFLMVITDISRGILPPLKKRLTFMFSPLD